jgi:hypothetical protein
MGQPRRRQVRQALLAIVAAVSITGCASVPLQTQNAREERPFFQQEQETEIHGRKNWLDYLVEADPGTFQVETASDYQYRPPAVLAVLPFGDVGEANFTIDKIPITFRNKEQQERWAWTDAQRLRFSVMGHLAQREFSVVNPISVDAVLKHLGIDSMNKLKRVSPLKLGRLLAADAVVYGEVDNYEGYYFGIVSAYHVGVSMWMTSTHDGEMLMRAKGGRYSVDLEPALSPQDFAINSIKTLLSVKTLLEFRDITLARAEEEVGRELVLRIPVSETLKMQLAKRGLEKAQEADSDQEGGFANQDNPHAMNTIRPTTLLLGSRHEHAVGEYTEVHQDLARVAQNYDKLTPAERQEPNDDRCLTEYPVVRWSYSLSERERTCSEALAKPSANGGVLARIHEATKRSAAKEVRRALDAQDLPDAGAAALAYGASPGADSELLAGWSKDIWQAVHRPKRSAEREQQVASVIAQLANEYPQAKTMSELDFTHWVIAASIVSNKSVVSSLRIKEDTLDLLVSKDDLRTVATNLYRFVRINDAFAARCGCDARTNIGIADVGFPAYLFRLDPEERTSKILIAIGAPAVGPTRPVSPSPGEAVAQPLETRPATESSQDAQTAKRSRAATLEGMTGGGGTGALGSSPRAGSASSPQQPAPREQPKLKSTRLESESDFQPSSSQPFQGPTSKANPQRLDFPTPPPDAVAHALPTGASFLRSRSSEEATARGRVNHTRGLSAQQDDTQVSSYIAL